MVKSQSQLTLEEFLALPDDDVACELIDGQAVPKMSPKFFHSMVQSALLILMYEWCEGRGRVGTECSVILKRQGKDWVPAPDLLYISYERLPADWMKDEACPTPCELAIEIISPGQTFGELTAKATDYLAAGVLRVWIIDKITVNDSEYGDGDRFLIGWLLETQSSDRKTAPTYHKRYTS